MQDPQQGWTEAMRAVAASTAPTSEEVAQIRSRLAEPPSTGAGRWGALAAFLMAGTLGALALVGTWSDTSAIDVEGESGLESSAVVIDWVVGSVSAKPGIDTTIRTAEALWQGTHGGEVTRDRLGTHGDEALHCFGDTKITAGGTTCLPTTPAGWLGRGHALSVSEGGREGVDEAYLRAGSEGTGVVRAEAYAALADRRIREGAFLQAAQHAESALEEGVSARADELHRLAARSYLLLEDCRSAVPHLASLSVMTDEESAYAERCSN